MKNRWHQHILRVHYKDTDQMSVAHHGNYVGWFEIGRTEMMRSAGIAYSEMEKRGLLLPVIDLSIQYRRPAHYDDCIAVSTKITDFSAARLQFAYEIRRSEEKELSSTPKQSETPYGELLASGTTLHMWLNHKWKPARIDKVAPEMFQLLNEGNDKGKIREK